jgi:hypothetical protein
MGRSCAHGSAGRQPAYKKGVSELTQLFLNYNVSWLKQGLGRT